MAHVRKLPSGKWIAQCYIGGQRPSKTFRTKREAEAWGAQTEIALEAASALPPAQKHTLADLLTRYRDEVSPAKRGAKWEHLRCSLFLRGVGLPVDRLIGDIKAADIAAWRDARLRQVRPGSVLRELGLLSAAFEVARREWGWLADNPVRDVRKPRSPDHRERVISWREIRAMCRSLNVGRSSPVREVRQAVGVCFLVALRTGARAGELCGLTWDRVLPGKARVHHKTGRTRESLRDIPLTHQAQRLIERMRGWDESLVFGLKTATLDALFRRYRIKAGLEGFTFHDARHTAATHLARRVDVLDLCKAFGWSSTKQALTYYNPRAEDIAVRMAMR